MEQEDTKRQQMGVRIAANLIVETKVLAARQKRRLNEMVEEALEILLKKYREKKKGS
jgi:predicted HicB family RNase H-like nuclease